MPTPTADWTTTPEALRKYAEARSQAQASADADGMDRGIERNDLFREFRVFMLPRRENRRGNELRCEVVSCTDLSRCQVGHGPMGATGGSTALSPVCRHGGPAGLCEQCIRAGIRRVAADHGERHDT